MPDFTAQYPIGKFEPKPEYSSGEIQGYIHQLEQLPDQIEAVFQQLLTKLETPYRPGGWTARQVLHHLTDSHLNAYIRTKWTLTEDTPLIKAYLEKKWAETPDVALDPALAVTLLRALHAKWTALLRKLSATDFQRSFIHPETRQEIRLDRMIALYAWHGQHHLAHLRLILDA
jgi:hypothetical protein